MKQIEIILATTQDLKTFKTTEDKVGFNFDFRHCGGMNEGVYLLNTTIEDWDLLHKELTKGNLEVIGIWKSNGEIATDENVDWKVKEVKLDKKGNEVKDVKPKKEDKNKFKKTKYKSHLAKIKQPKKNKKGVDTKILEEVDAPETTMVGCIYGWGKRQIDLEE